MFNILFCFSLILRSYIEKKVNFSYLNEFKNVRAKWNYNESIVLERQEKESVF